jgi:uncharacterized membrane protein YobD (UPF0266 family)
LRGNAFGEKAQTIPQTRHSAGLAVVMIDADLTEKGAQRETNLMADRLQAVTIFYKFVQYSKKLLQKCTIWFLYTFFERNYRGRPQQDGDGGRTK